MADSNCRILSAFDSLKSRWIKSCFFCLNPLSEDTRQWPSSRPPFSPIRPQTDRLLCRFFSPWIQRYGSLFFLQIFARLLPKNSHKTLRQTHVLQSNRLAEQRGYFFVPEAGNATADARYIEEQLRMLLRESDERRNVRLDGLHATLHSGDGVALTTKADTTTHYGTKLFPSSKRRTASVHSFQVAALCKRLHKAAYVKSEIM